MTLKENKNGIYTESLECEINLRPSDEFSVEYSRTGPNTRGEKVRNYLITPAAFLFLFFQNSTIGVFENGNYSRKAKLTCRTCSPFNESSLQLGNASFNVTNKNPNSNTLQFLVALHNNFFF